MVSLMQRRRAMIAQSDVDSWDYEWNYTDGLLENNGWTHTISGTATSSMTVGGLKVSLASRAADLIIGDTDILKNAPRELLVSGLGDMLAKYISIAEWRISNLLTGEYYCEDIAELMRSSLAECVEKYADYGQQDILRPQSGEKMIQQKNCRKKNFLNILLWEILLLCRKCCETTLI